MKKKLVRVWKWWASESWKDSVDLGLKFTAILGAIIAGNLLVLNAELVWSAWIQVLIDLEEVQGAYEAVGVSMPSEIEQEIDDINSAGAYTSRLVGSLDWEESSSLSNSLGLIMRNNSEARWESCHLSHLSLSSEDLEFAANAFNNARYAVVNIELSNNGQATARNVSIIHPDAFRLSGTEEKFDLLPGQSRSIMLETENLAPLQGSIQVVYDRETSLFVDSQNVSLIGGSFIVIWFISVLLSISYSFFDIDSLFDKPPELYSQQRDAVTISSVRHMLTRIPISRGQRALYKLLYMAGDKGLSSSELATATGWSKSQLSGVLGALGRRVNDTEGFERNRGIEEILETSLLDDGDSHYRMRSVLREALEAESLV